MAATKSSVSFDFSGKLVLVTGSSKGIGYALAEAYYRSGAAVIINGRSETSVNAAIEKITAATADDAIPESAAFHALPCDLSDKDAVAAAVETINGWGDLDVLINNAGYFWVCKFEETSDEDWDDVWNGNVMSGIRLARAFLPKMMERDSGNIIFISSECGFRPIPHMLPYSVSKAAQLSVARGLAEITKGTNVRVNSLLPGPTWTEGVEEFLKGIKQKRIEDLGPDASEEDIAALTDDAVARQYFEVNEPTSLIQRFLTTDEIASATMFLSSDAASGINGIAQKVEGGIIRSI